MNYTSIKKQVMINESRLPPNYKIIFYTYNLYIFSDVNKNQSPTGVYIL